ncbi:hypothetical protein [Roseovarius sp. TE539]|uniref:hypothetical protein n=1 Tax=Roseovarius sp. TE539 TaxID=2249812 RepID=UPI0011BE249B|nr:hypothetical protein [Roseovarius sp. TE539]
MQVPVDHARRQVAPVRIVKSRIRSLAMLHIPDRDNVPVLDGDLGGIDLGRGHVDQPTTTDHKVGFDITMSGADHFSEVHETCLPFFGNCSPSHGCHQYFSRIPDSIMLSEMNMAPFMAPAGVSPTSRNSI